MGRAPCCDKASVKKGPWSPEEDAQLKAYIEAHGTGGNWIALPHKIGLNRCGKSCRLRWLNYLRPNIRHGGFSEEEDRTICSLYISIGSRWSVIAAQLPGRTDNDVKNYWNTKLKKRLLGRRRDAPPPRRRLLATQCQSEQGGAPIARDASQVLERMRLHMQLRQGLEGPFSLYNNPAPWPRLPPPVTGAGATPAAQLFRGTYNYSGVVSSHQVGLENVRSWGMSTQESLGSSTPMSSTTTTETSGMENSSSTVSSVAMGIDDEIDMLLHQIKCFEAHDQHEVAGLGCFEETGETTEYGIGNLCAGVGGAGKEVMPGSWSSYSASGLDSLFEGYVQRYSQ